mmetsp:Transcript_46374/g.129288  ORF Transcript_46374/g.129288 Transcript_46374/m.129288 type:complete len:215 (-) Transcript_46374:103-747(-)
MSSRGRARAVLCTMRRCRSTSAVSVERPPRRSLGMAPLLGRNRLLGRRLHLELGKDLDEKGENEHVQKSAPWITYASRNISCAAALRLDFEAQDPARRDDIQQRVRRPSDVVDLDDGVALDHLVLGRVCVVPLPDGARLHAMHLEGAFAVAADAETERPSLRLDDRHCERLARTRTAREAVKGAIRYCGERLNTQPPQSGLQVCQLVVDVHGVD